MTKKKKAFMFKDDGGSIETQQFRRAALRVAEAIPRPHALRSVYDATKDSVEARCDCGRWGYALLLFGRKPTSTMVAARVQRAYDGHLPRKEKL